jgi:hypothetical protein
VAVHELQRLDLLGDIPKKASIFRGSVGLFTFAQSIRSLKKPSEDPIEKLSSSKKYR